MKQETKIILLISGAVILVGAIGLGIYLHYAGKKEKEDKDKKGDGGNDPGNKDGNNTANDPTYTPPPNYNPPAVPGTVSPQYNSENELINDLSELKDRVLYPKRKEAGGMGYANIRSSAEVNTDRGWWDLSDNLLTTINSGTPIGKVTGETSGLFNGYSYRWFKVKLLQPVGFWGSTYDGFVRADTVTIKPYEQ